jgi:hypothetical protein
MAKADLKTITDHIDSIIKKEKEKARGLLNRETHIYTVSYKSFARELIRQLRSVRKFSPLTDLQYAKIIIKLSKAFTKNLYDSIKSSLGDKVNFTANSKYSSEISTDAFKATLSKANHPSPFSAFQVARQVPISKLKDSVVEELFNKFNLDQDYIDYTKMSDEDLARIKNDVGNKAKKVLAPVGSKLEMHEMLSSRIYGSTRAAYKGGPLLRTEDGAVVRERGMSDLGHAKSVAVNKLILPIIAQKIIEGTIVEEIAKLSVRYSITSSVSMALKDTPKAKSFDIEVEVYDESSSQNRADGSREKKELTEKTEELKDLILKEIRNNDWANQESSPSFMKLVRSSILSSAVRIKGQNIIVKVDKSGIIPMKGSAPTTLTKNRKGTSNSRVVASGKGSQVVSEINTTRPSQSAPTQRTPNWLQLLPMINSRLTDTVAKNMKSPKLNFRTGRFAQSAKVVNVEQTSQGFPSFVFDYERDPYDVFDRTLGRNPWNTPQRDPRALVDQSVREIVREMAIGRFFTRRA